jgi:hypothetical protein
MTSKALLCGVNAYADIPLRGCVNDVYNLQRVLLDRYGFPPQQVRLLLDADCVKSHLLESWRWLTEDASPGDVLLFHFSGHGSYIPDTEGEEEDMRDEITCLQNFAFDDPDSYISDDEWYEMTQAVDPGVHLMLIKDTCHSGGSSRFISVRQDSGIEKIILANERDLSGYQAGHVFHEQSVSNARFIVPSQLPAESWQRAGQTRRSARTAALTHTNLMACGEAQTAADAHINGDYQGAFTFTLCEVLLQDGHSSSEDVIRQVVDRLRGRYDQIPQHEGSSFALALLADGTAAERPIPEPMPLLSSSSAAEQGQGAQGLSAPQMVYLAHMRFLDTMRLLQAGAPATQREQPRPPRVLVTVHGIGNHQEGYSTGWWSALSPHVGGLFEPSGIGQGRAEVLWSDLVNQQRSVGSAEQEAQTLELRQAILEVLDDRRLQQAEDPSRAIREAAGTRGADFAIDDFLIYMVNPDMRQRILARFTGTLRPLLAAGTQLEVISHSWGTVVAYEGLRELEREQGFSGRVNTWFTVGSALSLPPVQASLRPENRPSRSRKAAKPALVSSWINLDAKGDLVGGPLGHRFSVGKEYLNLAPTGCARSLIGYNLGCAHGSYFQAANIEVNRDIFAANILAMT